MNSLNIPEPKIGQKRIVILGVGFAGLKFAKKLSRSNKFQIVIIDKNNYHQFQPLLYQVATAGLETSNISFPIRKIFQNKNNVFIRVAKVNKIDPNNKIVFTNIGSIHFSKLIISLGTTTNYYGNKQIEEKSIGLKSVSEAIHLRNTILKNYEQAILAKEMDDKDAALNIVIVGGGATGVELSGALAEMRNKILPKEYNELDFTKMNIYLIESLDRLLNNMSEYSSSKVKKYLEKLGVKILLSTRVEDYDGVQLTTDKLVIKSLSVIWTAGVQANNLLGLPITSLSKGGRIIVNEFHEVRNCNDIYAIGDISILSDRDYPIGLPQVAQVAIQQAKNLAYNILGENKNKTQKPFRYKDKGTMATVGRNLAVVELPYIKFSGIFAWLTWMFVHLMSILGIKNRFFILINWVSNYFTSNLSLRLIIKEKRK